MAANVGARRKRHALLVICCCVTNYPVLNYGCNNAHHMCFVTVSVGLGMVQLGPLPQGSYEVEVISALDQKGHASLALHKWLD